MAINKQQQIWFGVLAIAAAAWATDRFVLGGGATSPSSAEASLLVTHQEAAPVAPVASRNPARVATLNERLALLAAQGDLAGPPARDIFSPPASWLPVDKPTAPAAAEPGISAEDFRHTHPLTAVVRAGRNSQIFMGERIVRLGQSVDGYRLISVTQSSATFSANGTRVTLELEDNSDNLSAIRTPDKTPPKTQ